MLSNTKVNTLRVTWTRENVTFANACFNGNGRDLARASRRWPSRLHRSAGQHRRSSASTTASQLEDTLAWFLPGKRGDHDIKVGVQYVYSGAKNENQGNLNGTFAFGQNDLDFDPPTRDLSGSLHHPRRRPERSSTRRRLLLGVRAGQVAA